MFPMFVAGFGVLLLSMTLEPTKLLAGRLKPRSKLKLKLKVNAKFNQVAVLMETPDFLALLWFAIAAGEPLDSSLRIATSRTRGFISSEFQKVLLKVDHGALLQHELENLAAESKSEQVRELAGKLAVALYNGSALAEQLAEFAGSTNAELRTVLLDRAGKSETKMMIPLVFIILPVTVMFALYPSVVIIQNSFI